MAEIVAEVPDQHSAYYCAQLAREVDTLRTINKPIAQTRLGAEFENVCQAWEWAVNHGQVERLQNAVDGFGLLLMRMGRYHEGAARFEQALQQLEVQAHPDSADDVHHYVFAQLLVWCGEFFHFLGHNTRANRMLRHALDILTGPILEKIDTRHTQAAAFFCLGDTVSGEAARECFQRALDLARTANDRWLESNALQSLSSLFLRESLGSLDEIKGLVEESLKIHREINDPWGVSWNLLTLSRIALNQGNITTGRYTISESLQISQQLNLETQIVRCNAMYGNLALVAGEFKEANERYRQSLALWIELNLPNEAVFAQCNLAWSMLHAGSYAAAHREATEAQQLFQDEPALNQAIDRAHFVLGLLALASGENSAGRQHLQLSVEQAVLPSTRAYSLCGLALAARGLNSASEARRYLDEALKATQRIGVYLLMLHTLNVATLLLADAGDTGYARDLYTILIKHPFNANSHWVKDMIGLPLEQALHAAETDTFHVKQIDQENQQWCTKTRKACQQLVGLLGNSDDS